MRNEDFFYEGAERGDLLDALNGRAHEGATTVLEGEAGSGVSTLLGMLCMSLVGDFELIRLDGAESLGANAVVDAILVHFGVQRSELADTLKQTLADSRLIVVVDNAGQLPEAALSTMTSLKQKLGGRLAYVFGGRPGTADGLRQFGLAVADTLNLPALDAGQVAEFAEQALAIDLSEEESEALWVRSGGQPGPLWHLLDERRGRRPAAGTRRPIPLRHGLAVAALLLVVLVLWLASGDHQPQGDKVVDIKLPAPPVKVQKEEGQPGQGGLKKPHKPGLVSSPEQSRQALAEYNPSASDFERAEAPASPDKQSAGSGGGQTVTSDDEPAGAAAAPASPPPAPRAAPSGSVNKSAAATADAGKPAASHNVVADQKPKLSGLDAELGYHQEDWLATRPDSDWFLQVIATGREDGARGVLDRLDHKGAYYRTTRGGKPVYLVLAGPYPSRDAALKARAALPDTLRKAGPFPRGMAEIKKELH